MTLISLEDAKAEVRKVVPDFKTRYDINYRLNNLPSIELEEDRKTEPQINADNAFQNVESVGCDRYVITNDEGERAYNCIGCERTDCSWK